MLCPCFLRRNPHLQSNMGGSFGASTVCSPGLSSASALCQALKVPICWNKNWVPRTLDFLVGGSSRPLRNWSYGELASSPFSQVPVRFFGAYWLLHEVYSSLWSSGLSLNCIIKEEFLSLDTGCYSSLWSFQVSSNFAPRPPPSEFYLDIRHWVWCKWQWQWHWGGLNAGRAANCIPQQSIERPSSPTLYLLEELLSLVTSVQKCSPYLLGHPFVVRSDHQALKFLLEQQVWTIAQQCWLSKLLGYDFVIEYKQGRDNRIADACLASLNSLLVKLNFPSPWFHFQPRHRSLTWNPHISQTSTLLRLWHFCNQVLQALKGFPFSRVCSCTRATSGSSRILPSCTNC